MIKADLTLEELMREPTTDVRTAGRVFYNLSDRSSYAAARSGDIPTLRVGGRIFVPVAKVLEQLGIKPLEAVLIEQAAA